MKSVMTEGSDWRQSEPYCAPMLSSTQIDANFAELEAEIAELKRASREIQIEIGYRVGEGHAADSLLARVQDLEAARGQKGVKFPEVRLSSSGQSFIAYSDAVKLEKQIRLEERKRAAEIVRGVISDGEPPCVHPLDDVIKRILDGAEPEPTQDRDRRQPAWFRERDEPLRCFTQADLDAAIKANNERAVAWIRRFTGGWRFIAEPPWHLKDLYNAILNNDEVPG